jgi:CRISPR-associated endonuclease/helicase Cas3
MGLPVIDGPSDLENLPRYRVARGEDPWPMVEATMRAGGKVLWVANTVDRSLAAADHAATCGFSPLVYHSRFRYMDRVQRHQDVVAAFKGDQGCFAVATQVAEMSLDLSADLLVTETAPVPALIQRMGRLNRRSSPRDPQPVKPAFVLEPGNHRPYEPADLDCAREWLATLGTGDLSQRDLVAAWVHADSPVAEVASAWLDGGLDTEPRELREDSPGITVLMHGDAELARVDPSQALARTVPMPPVRGADWLAWPQVAHYPVAPVDSILYDPKRGARWAK